MTTPKELYKAVNPRQLLTQVLDLKIPIKFHDRHPTSDEIDFAIEKIKALIEDHKRTILLRGITKSSTKKKLISRLNSNDSLYDGLFLVGDKAKNFLEKSENIPHPIKVISSIGEDTASWIFSTYSKLTYGPIDLDFFKDKKNKRAFVDNVKDNEELTDYYLFGLHTYNSENLVNFVSTTSFPEVALYSQLTDKLVIILWLPLDYTLYITLEKIKALKNIVIGKALPLLSDSFYPNEDEVSFKGFILPHFIVGVHDIDANELIINPSILENKTDWKEKGFNIDQTNFHEFIKQTKYKRFLILTNKLEEKNVC